MHRTVIAGVDGSAESRIAAGWAAEEAQMRDASLRLLHAWVRQPYEYAPLSGMQSALPPRGGGRDGVDVSLLVDARLDLQRRHPGLVISAEEIAEQAVPALLDAAQEAELLVLGSRRPGAVAASPVGSVALATVAHAERPVVLVGEQNAEVGAPAGPDPTGDVVIGLDTRHPADPLIAFAFDAAGRRAARLRVVQSLDGSAPAPPSRKPRSGPRPAGGGPDGALDVWREKFPDVRVDEQVVAGDGAATHLVDASREAALLVVGRRTHHSRADGRIDAVTRTVLDRSHAPVAVVPHD